MEMSKPKVFESNGRTKIEWKVSGFYKRKQMYSEVKSPTFNLFNSAWCLTVYPAFHWNLSPTVCMRLDKESKEEFNIEYEMGIQNADGIDFRTEKFKCKGNDSTPIHKIILRNRLQPSPDKFLTVFCSVRLVTEPAVKVSSQMPRSSDKGITNLSEDFKNLYLDKRLSDVAIKVGNKTFFGHRAILSARSAVFAAMFQHDMIEKNSGVVKISDCDPVTFDEFLIFLYTGNISSNDPVNLYKTAEKYDVKDLKKECVHCMARYISAESFCDVFHLAKMYKESNLMTVATEFFIDNAADILPTENWKKFLAENASLANEMFTKFVNKSRKDNVNKDLICKPQGPGCDVTLGSINQDISSPLGAIYTWFSSMLGLMP